MELIHHKAKEAIDQAKKVLLVAHAKMDGDTLTANLAMESLLTKLGKQVTVVCADAVPEVFTFLPHANVLQKDIEGGADMVITLDCADVKPQKLKWKLVDNQLKIFVTPQSGSFDASKVIAAEQDTFDLIITLDVADVHQMGAIYTDHQALFEKLPVICFDHHASNPGFGDINIIDTHSASTTEVLYHFLPTWLGDDWQKKVDADIATLLLTGIITDTGSFQNANTTPQSLEVAAELVELGARQQEIIRHVFKTKNIATLRLWGRVLSKIKTDPVHRLIWSSVSAEDLSDLGATIDDTEGIIDELLATAPGMEMVMLVKERPDGVTSISLRTTTPTCDAAEFAGQFGGGGHTQAAGFKIRNSKSFEVTLGEVIHAAQEFQAARLRTDEMDIIPKEEEVINMTAASESQEEDLVANPDAFPVELIDNGQSIVDNDKKAESKEQRVENNDQLNVDSLQLTSAHQSNQELDQGDNVEADDTSPEESVLQKETRKEEAPVDLEAKEIVKQKPEIISDTSKQQIIGASEKQPSDADVRIDSETPTHNEGREVSDVAIDSKQNQGGESGHEAQQSAGIKNMSSSPTGDQKSSEVIGLPQEHEPEQKPQSTNPYFDAQLHAEMQELEKPLETPDLSHEEFSEMLEKMMQVDPVQKANDAPQSSSVQTKK